MRLLSGRPAGRSAPGRARRTATVSHERSLNGARLAAAIGVSESSVSRLAAGALTIELGSKEAELAALVVRCFRSLDALVGGDDARRRAWMASHNRALNGVPPGLGHLRAGAGHHGRVPRSDAGAAVTAAAGGSPWRPEWLASLRRRRAVLWRGVEAQHRIATMKVVDSVDEQDLLEALLERSKPPLPPQAEDLHYLIATPFRYLSAWPSRFRGPGEPGARSPGRAG